ncbi:hypothetical protein [Streptomyces guryensis]|uniref:Uncharacterized protein n=1 Tax=Streptomyces guryensis TaxID=2886947 RepID=A0A9Q3ZCS2_9ACTN|nr:hypothetical protein [Streptomyces guryensis]MCD9879927.1 hypothetical protein [Streptomyces guryensis]
MTPLTPASPEVTDLAARHRLGALQRVFAPKRLGRAVFAAHVFNCLMLMLFFLVPGLLYHWFCMRRFPDFSRKRVAQRLRLFEEGLVVHPLSGGEPVALRWDALRVQQEITQLIINCRPAPTRYTYSASTPGQGSVRITEFYEDPGVWGPRMQDAVVRAQRAPPSAGPTTMPRTSRTCICSWRSPTACTSSPPPDAPAVNGLTRPVVYVERSVFPPMDPGLRSARVTTRRPQARRP